jgi:DNA-binding NarL/FixJ family response regulator
MKPASGIAAHLVVVDPDVAFARMAKDWLREGFPLHQVGSIPHLSTRLDPAPHLALIEAALLQGDLTHAVALLRRRWPRTSILVYDDSPMEAALQQVLAAELAGWLVKPLSPATLVAAVAVVLEGCTVFATRPGSAVTPALSRHPPSSPTVAHRTRLSQRQAQIIELLARGNTEKEVANLLRMSARTVNHHVERIYRRWGVHNRAEALRFWLIPTGRGSNNLLR